MLKLTWINEEGEPVTYMLKNVGAILHVDDDPAKGLQNIEIDGITNGDVVLFDSHENHQMLVGTSLSRKLMVKTGDFSSEDRINLSAKAGLKNYSITISYAIVNLDDNWGEYTSSMQFEIGSD